MSGPCKINSAQCQASSQEALKGRRKVPEGRKNIARPLPRLITLLIIAAVGRPWANHRNTSCRCSTNRTSFARTTISRIIWAVANKTGNTSMNWRPKNRPWSKPSTNFASRWLKKTINRIRWWSLRYRYKIEARCWRHPHQPVAKWIRLPSATSMQLPPQAYLRPNQARYPMAWWCRSARWCDLDRNNRMSTRVVVWPAPNLLTNNLEVGVVASRKIAHWLVMQTTSTCPLWTQPRICSIRTNSSRKACKHRSKPIIGFPTSKRTSSKLRQTRLTRVVKGLRSSSRKTRKNLSPINSSSEFKIIISAMHSKYSNNKQLHSDSHSRLRKRSRWRKVR